jgi:hypothetical protein
MIIYLLFLLRQAQRQQVRRLQQVQRLQQQLVQLRQVV